MNIETLKLKYPDTVIKDNGFNVWIFGNTKPHKDALKADGFRWSTKKYGWWKKSDAQQAPTAAILPELPEPVPAPVPAASEDPETTTPAGYLPAPVFDRERDHYKAAYLVSSVAASAGSAALEVLRSWKGLYNVRLINAIKDAVGKLIPEKTDTEIYHCYIGYYDSYRLQLHMSISYQYAYKVNRDGFHSYDTIKSEYYVIIPARNRALTAEEKEAIIKDFQQQQQHKADKAEENKNIFWNLPDLQHDLLEITEVIRKTKDDFYKSNPLYWQVTYNRKYNNGLRLYEIE